jgi:hypothetical protein
MTLAERMTTINNAEHSLTDGINDFTFQEACNKWLIETGTINGVDYSGININKYTPEEAFAIIRHKTDLRSETLNELVSELGSYYPIHKYTAIEALNKKDAVLVPYSLNFSGSTQYVDCGTGIGTSILGDNYSGDLSVSLWFKADVTSGNDGLFYIGAFGGANGEFEIMLVSNVLKFNLNGWETWHRDVAFTDTASWHHLVCVHDLSGGEAKMYLDTVAVGSTTGSLPTAANMDYSGKKTIIGGYVSNSYTFDGKMDEISIFNKALTQAEVTSLYAADPQNAGDAVGITNLVGYWKFDEGTGEPQDTSGNGNHGTITGATWTVH